MESTNYDISHLTPEQRTITQEKGTELPFTGELLNNKATGMYKCVVCGQELFSSDTKYESNSGWPSFYAAVDNGHIKLIEDNSAGMTRTEVACARCGAHLGHLFEDGPQPTGMRYCINSAALQFAGDAKPDPTVVPPDQQVGDE